jgi:CheY-like chemotaxis protein
MQGEGRITVSVARDGDHAVIEVIDTGIGMAPDVLVHAMEPFFTARADGSGTGLGLAMVYGFIRQSGGDVAILSAPGRGTTVRLSLPLATDARPVLPAFGTVLLVEDDAEDQLAAQRILLCCAARLDVTDSTAEALRRLEHPVDLVVTDLSLQGRVAGWSVAKAALARHEKALAIVVSGRLPDVNPLAASYPHRVATLAKPLTAAALAEAVATLRSNDRDDGRQPGLHA